MKKKDVFEIPDKSYLTGIISSTINSKITIIGLLFIIILLIFMLVANLNKPPLVTVIEENTGKTYTSTTKKLSNEIVQMQVLYYTKDFIENYLSLDGSNTVARREKASKMMTSETYEKYGKDHCKTEEVQVAKSKKYLCNYNYIRFPVITAVNFPYYTSFTQVERIISLPGYKPVKTTFNVKLEFKWIKGLNPFKHPTGLLISDIKMLDEKSREFKDQINKSY